MTSGTPVRPTKGLLALLPLPLLLAGCTSLTQSTQDLGALRMVAQGRYDRVTAVSAILNTLIAQPAPKGMNAKEQKAWDDQTNWLIRVNTHLVGFSSSLNTVLNTPVPSGLDLDNAIRAAQLAQEFSRLNDEFQGIVALVKEETTTYEENSGYAAAAKQDSVSKATGTKPKDERIVFSSPMKSRHDNAVNAISTLA